MATVTRSWSHRRVISGSLRNQYSKLSVALLATAPVAAALWGSPASAQTATWDSSGTTPSGPVDGSGNWDVQTSADWANGGGSDVAWPSGDVAQFGNGGTAGTVTIDDSTGSVSVGGINFNAVGSGNYTIAANPGDSLALTGTAAIPATITVAAGLSPVISADQRSKRPDIGGHRHAQSFGSKYLSWQHGIE